MKADCFFKYTELTEAIISAFYTVYNILGYGFLEKVYENALLLELRGLNLTCESQVPLKVAYKGQIVGDYFADIIVENKVLIEVKAAEEICPEHEAQILNYLKATDIEVGLILNFGPRAAVRRKAFDNSRKSGIVSA
ncbi:MAG: GxxExxY protein [Chlamydiota bacterium]